MELRIVRVPFHDPKALAYLGTVVTPRSTRATNDAALVESWLSTFDPVDSAQTLKLYRRVSSGFLGWLSTRGLALSGLTTDDLAAWRDQIKGAAATRANRLAVVKSLLSYAHVTGYARFNVGRAIRGPKVDVDADARGLTEFDVRRLITAAETQLQAERARAKPLPRFLRAALTKVYLCKFLYVSACRVSEVVSVTWGDLQPRPDGDVQLSVLGKGRKRRRFPLPRHFIEQLTMEYRPAAAQPGDRIFTFGARRAQIIISALANHAGLGAKISCHWLRHSAATHALDRGAPIHVVSQTLGHSSLATTSRYVHKLEAGAATFLPRL